MCDLKCLIELRRSQFHRNHFKIYCWTVNDRATAEALISRGVRGIISDDLALLASLPSGETARPSAVE